jgi:hypothetical protein
MGGFSENHFISFLFSVLLRKCNLAREIQITSSPKMKILKSANILNGKRGKFFFFHFFPTDLRLVCCQLVIDECFSTY